MEKPQKLPVISQDRTIPVAVLHDGNVPIYIFEDVTDIGRDGQNHISVSKSLRISRKHCVIKKSSDHKFTITDLSSTGTYVNGELVGKKKSRQLQNLDKISLANEQTYTFGINTSHAQESIEVVNSSFQEKMLNLDNTHSQDMMKLNEEMYEMESKKFGLKEEMNAKLSAQEEKFQQEYQTLTQLMATTVEQKVEMERKLREMEEKSKVEKEKLMQEVENKITDITKKAEEVQKLKEEMELKYEKERTELQERCKSEIEELKGKLVEYELKQEVLQGETKEVEQKLIDAKMVLIESEMEQHRLFEEKLKVETKLGATIENLTKESSNKDELLRNMRELLQEKEEATNRLKRDMEEYLEEQLQCSICTEVFIEPTVLPCGHMFCKTCIDEWKLKKKICPMCRTKITSCLRIYTIDGIVNKNVALMSSEAKERRTRIIEERKVSSQVPAKKRKNHHRVHASTSTSTALHPAMVATNQVAPNFFGDRFDMGSPVHRLRVGTPIGPDPFAWEQLENRTEMGNVVHPIVLDDNWMGPQQPPVSVAAIDLTNIPHFPEPPQQRVRNEAATSTALNDTVDLTNL